MTGPSPTQPDPLPSSAQSRDGQPGHVGGGRDPDLVLAGLHLRLGALGLARAELEGFAGAGRLDPPALADLAEVRWRTGDLVGAGEAASVALESGDARVSTYVIAAEAMAKVGRPGEARRLASHALEASGGSVGDTFAGMPRSSVWPTDAPGSDGPVDAVAPGGSAIAPGRGAEAAMDILPEPGDSMEAARTALARGDAGTAALHLAIALRVAPGVAPDVVTLLAGVDDPAAALVRGDAYRLVGHERDAHASFAAAVQALASHDEPADPPPTDPTKETT
jgi:hypothetical protein